MIKNGQMLLAVVLQLVSGVPPLHATMAAMPAARQRIGSIHIHLIKMLLMLTLQAGSTEC
jgi:hypothetical protein